MQWLLHGSITPAVAEELARHEHKTHQVSELGLKADATPVEMLKSAAERQWDIMTTDAVLADAPFSENVLFSRTIVLLAVGAGDVEQDDAIERLFDRYKRLAPKRLYTVTPTRVKIRQLPGSA